MFRNSIETSTEFIGRETTQIRITPPTPAGGEPSEALAPTYFVKHPDESFSVADPQPKSVARTHANLVERLAEVKRDLLVKEKK